MNRATFSRLYHFRCPGKSGHRTQCSCQQSDQEWDRPGLHLLSNGHCQIRLCSTGIFGQVANAKFQIGIQIDVSLFLSALCCFVLPDAVHPWHGIIYGLNVSNQCHHCGLKSKLEPHLCFSGDLLDRIPYRSCLHNTSNHKA